MAPSQVLGPASLFVPLLLLVAVLAISSTQATTAGVSTAFQKTLFAMDCKGGIHLLPDTPAAVSIINPAHVNVFNGLYAQITSRVKCRCPNVAQGLLDARYHPVGAILNGFATDGQEQGVDGGCLDAEETYVRSFSDVVRSSISDFAVTFPSTCTPERWVKEGKCALTANTTGAGFNTRIALTKCSGNDERGNPNVFPALSVHCDGPRCSLFTPCTADADCSNDGSNKESYCRDLSKEIFDEEKRRTIEGVLADLFVYETKDGKTQTLNIGLPEIVESIMKVVVPMFPGGKAQPKGTLKVCMPRDFGLLEDLINEQSGDDAPPKESDSINWGESRTLRRCGNLTSLGSGERISFQYVNDLFKPWDGNLQGALSAHASERLSGSAYGKSAALPKAANETYFAGFGCGGEVRVLPGTAIGPTVRLHRVHELINAVMSPLRQIWKARGLESKFAASMELWRPEAWLAAAFADVDGKMHHERLHNASIVGAAWGFYEYPHAETKGHDARTLGRRMAAAARTARSTLAHVTANFMPSFTGIFEALKSKNDVESTATMAKATATKAAPFRPEQEQVYARIQAAARSAFDAVSTTLQQTTSRVLAHIGAPATVEKAKKAHVAEDSDIEIDPFLWGYFYPPKTVTWTKWAADGQVGAKLNLSIADQPPQAFRALVQNCPAVRDAPPAIHLTCNGPTCSSMAGFGLDKVCATNQDCGARMECSTIAEANKTLADDWVAMILFGRSYKTLVSDFVPANNNCTTSKSWKSIKECNDYFRTNDPLWKLPRCRAEYFRGEWGDVAASTGNATCANGALAMVDVKQLWYAFTGATAARSVNGALKVCVPVDNGTLEELGAGNMYAYPYGEDGDSFRLLNNTWVDLDDMPAAKFEMTFNITGDLTDERKQKLKEQVAFLAGASPNNIVFTTGTGETFRGKFTTKDTTLTATIYGVPNPKAAALAVHGGSASLGGVVVNFEGAPPPPPRDNGGAVSRPLYLLVGLIVALSSLLLF